MFDDRTLAEFSALDPVYVDGIAGVFNLGQNYSSVFFRWAPVRSDGGIITYEKVPVMVLVQPRAGTICGKGCRLTAILDAQHPPEISAQRVAGALTT